MPTELETRFAGYSRHYTGQTVAGLREFSISPDDPVLTSPPGYIEEKLKEARVILSDLPKYLRANNFQMEPEIKGVMDRMLARQRSAEAARNAQDPAFGLNQFFGLDEAYFQIEVHTGDPADTHPTMFPRRFDNLDQAIEQWKRRLQTKVRNDANFERYGGLNPGVRTLESWDETHASRVEELIGKVGTDIYGALEGYSNAVLERQAAESLPGKLVQLNEEGLAALDSRLNKQGFSITDPKWTARSFSEVVDGVMIDNEYVQGRNRPMKALPLVTGILPAGV